MATRFGKLLTEGLREFADDLESGKQISARYNMRKVVVDLKPKTYTAEDVRRVREVLDASQSVFAALLGVSVKSVQKWEQGEQAPGPMACRFMDEIAEGPEHFRRRLQACIRMKTETNCG